MKTSKLYLTLPLLVLCTVTGCDVILALLSSSTVTVSLVNNSDYAVRVSLYIDDEQLTPEILMTELGTESVYTIPAGQTTTFVKTCDALQAIIIDDADLLVVGGLGPEANSGVLRDDDDFSCGDTIIFTFDHSAAILDFDVSSSVTGS